MHPIAKLPMVAFSLALVSLLSPFSAHAEPAAAEADEVIVPGFLTRDGQASLTPQAMLSTLIARNRDFVEGNLTIRNTSKRIREAAGGQHPGAVILSCLDSRVPVEDVFHSGIGDLFVARVAGNVSTPEILGSLEYACKVAGAKVIVVLGHSNCGAVKSAIDKVELGNITALLRPVRAAADKVPGFDGERTSKNAGFVEAVCRENIQHAIHEIRDKSPILKEMEAGGAILIVGAEYDLDSGTVTFLEPVK